MIGVLGLARFDPGEYDQSAIELVQSFAEQAVIAIAGAKTLRELRDRTAELAERNDAYSERIDPSIGDDRRAEGDVRLARRSTTGVRSDRRTRPRHLWRIRRDGD